jgi:glycosyltransferase involved in cell wall biosynthesis
MLASRLGLENRLVFSDIKFYDNYPRKEMNKVYNVMDVFMLSTSGEGFGIPILEAMACEVPCVVTDYTTTYELLQEDGVCGISVPMLEMDKTFQEYLDMGLNFKQIDDIYTLYSTLTGSWCVERGLMSTGKCAEALTTYYKSPDLISKHGKVGREKALRGYTDEVVMNMWRKFFKDNLNG